LSRRAVQVRDRVSGQVRERGGEKAWVTSHRTGRGDRGFEAGAGLVGERAVLVEHFVDDGAYVAVFAGGGARAGTGEIEQRPRDARDTLQPVRAPLELP